MSGPSSVVDNSSVNRSLHSKGDISPNGSQRHDDPFQKFFEERDHMRSPRLSPTNTYAVAETDDAPGYTFTPYEMSILYSLLTSTVNSSIPLQKFISCFEYYIKPMAGGADTEYVGKMPILLKALQEGGIYDETGNLKTAETASVLESTPSAFSGVHLHIGVTATPSAIEFLLTNEKMTDKDHAIVSHALILLDTDKNGVFNLIIGFRELMRILVPIIESKGGEDPSAAFEEAREITRRILNTASVRGSDGSISLSDFIESYAMEVYVIPVQYRTLENAAMTRRIDLPDYSLLWAAVNQLIGIDAAHIEAALTETVSVEGVVADECSLHAVVKSVVSFVEEAAEKNISTDDALQQLSDLLVLNPTSLHIPVMPAEDRQEIAARKLQLYFKPSAVLSVLRALLLEDIRGDGILSKPMTEAALMVELSSSSHKKIDGSVGSPANVEEVEDFAGVDESRVEEMIRSVLLSAGVADSSQEVNLNHFIRTLIELTSVIPSKYCSDLVVSFPSPVQLNEILHLRELLATQISESGDPLTNPTGFGCVAEEVLRDDLQKCLASQRENKSVIEELVDAFTFLAPNGNTKKTFSEEDSRCIERPVLIDIADALSIATFDTNSFIFRISSLGDYHSNLVVGRRVSKGNVRQIAKAFVILDRERAHKLPLSVFREVMKTNPKFTSTEVLEEAFSVMDIDGDGALCLEEFISSFNHGPRGPALSKAQLGSLTTRRASVRELHTFQSCGDETAVIENFSSELAVGASTFVAGAINSPSKKAALIASLSVNTVGTTQNISAISSTRRSIKALSPQNDVSGVPVDDADLRAEFEQYDTANSGFIDRRNFATVYRNMENFGLEPSERDIESLFAKVCGHRNVITFPEFCLLMLRRSRM